MLDGTTDAVVQRPFSSTRCKVKVTVSDVLDAKVRGRCCLNVNHTLLGQGGRTKKKIVNFLQM